MRDFHRTVGFHGQGALQQERATATKYLSFAALALLIFTTTGDAQIGFPCQAFQMQPNGMLAVVQSVTITGPNGQITMNPGMSFGPGVSMMGINIYAAYQQNCR